MNKNVDEQMALRRKNLLLLKKQWGDDWQALAKKIGVTSSYLSQIQSGHRPFTEKAARKIEGKLLLARGWLELEHDHTVGTASQIRDDGLLERLIAAIDAALASEGLFDDKMTRRKYGHIINFVYEDNRERGPQSEAWIRRLLRLILKG